jgi:hypothetical protein
MLELELELQQIAPTRARVPLQIGLTQAPGLVRTQETSPRIDRMLEPGLELQQIGRMQEQLQTDPMLEPLRTVLMLERPEPQAATLPKTDRTREPRAREEHDRLVEILPQPETLEDRGRRPAAERATRVAHRLPEIVRLAA